MEHVAILLAGGSGSRMGPACADKILHPIGGRPAFLYALHAFAQSGSVDAIVIVRRDAQQEAAMRKHIAQDEISVPLCFVPGGATRAQSVRAGLDALDTAVRWVYLHDLARPAIRAAAIRSVRDALLANGCAVGLARPCTDTVRRFAHDPTTAPCTGLRLPREQIWLMETPQAFPVAILRAAHRAAAEDITDDLAAVEALGLPLLLVPSPAPNPKLTTAADLHIIESLLMQTTQAQLAAAAPARIGFGYDIHRFAPERALVLGGVTLQEHGGLLGHSDADVLSHAIADAILGAAGQPDIGHLFPNNDPAIAGINSQRILLAAVERARNCGWELVNIDCTVIAEKPKIAPHIPAMRAVLAATLQLQAEAIGIKATTNEGLGALGNAEGIAAHAVALLQSRLDG